MPASINPESSLFLASLSRIERRIESAQRQISSGIRLERPSDDPGAVMDVLQLQADLAANTQLRTNLDRDKAEVDAAESALQNAIKLVERAKTLGIQGASSITSNEQRAQLNEEVKGIQARLIGITQTTVNGRYIFSGDLDQTPAYEADPAGAEGVARLQYAPATRQVLEPGGTSFVAARTAHEIFDARDAAGDPTKENVFAAVQSLVAALEANDPPAIQTALNALGEAGRHLNAESSHYGVAQNRMAASIDITQQHELQFTTELAQKRDADLAVAATELSQAQLHQQAALSSRAMNRRPSLFEFLS
jgi:flagellar hook-associated protein 3 FlgL